MYVFLSIHVDIFGIKDVSDLRMSFIVRRQIRSAVLDLVHQTTKAKTVLLFGFDKIYINLDKWNGQIFRTENIGFSGTHQSIVLVAEELAKHGFIVYVACATVRPGYYNGVHYEHIGHITHLARHVNILISPTWIQIMPDPNVWNSLENMIFWFHLKGCPYEEYLVLLKQSFPNIKIYFNFLTNYVKQHADIHFEYYKKYIDGYRFIKNPIMFEFQQPIHNKRSHSFVFHSSFQRGGELACKVFNRLSYPDKILNICSYVNFELINDKYKIETKGKRDLYRLLADTEYYIYPGVNMETGILTKETDCLAVAEALLHEVIVFAFPVGALYENYKDVVVWIPFPSNAKLNSINTTPDSFEHELYSEEVIQSIQKLIEEIDSDAVRKEDIKKRGRELIVNQRNMNSICSELMKLFN